MPSIRSTGHLSYLNQQSTHGLAPCYASIEPQGRYCLVANYETGNLCVLPIQKDGSLGEATDTVQFAGSGPNPERQEGPHAHMVLPSPDGGFILAVDLGTDRLMAFRLDRERGTLSPADPPWTQLPPGTGPRHLAFHPHRPFAYVISELRSTVTVCRYWSSRARLRRYRPSRPCPTISQDRTWAGRSWLRPPVALSTPQIGGTTAWRSMPSTPRPASWRWLGMNRSQGVGPRAFTIDPSGALLLVANQDTDTVVTFWIDQ